MAYGIPMNSAWFQQDGARPHTSKDVLCFLHDIFKDRVLSNQYPVTSEEEFSWPPISQALKPLRLFSIGKG
jgi:hypothetical protein